MKRFFIKLLVSLILLVETTNAFTVQSSKSITSEAPFKLQELPQFLKDSKSGIVGAGVMTGLSSFATMTIAAADDYEIAELPPPYVPALFALTLLVGVGLLTGSLGDVMDEEASLGLQSGARAKKEIERSRSSYFRKK